MPEGVVRWYDSAKGEAEVVRAGRTYPVPAGQIPAAAGHVGARVQFDIERVDGVEEAVDVRLRPGTRSSRHHHRFGSLEGARGADTKGVARFPRVHPELRLAATHPLEVARAWATSVAAGDVDGALALYSPGALMHTDEGTLEGRSALHGWLVASPALGAARHARIRGSDNGGAVITWEPTEAGEPGLSVRCRMAHGEIAEQWLTEPSRLEALPAEETVVPVALHCVGDVGEAAKVQARRMIVHLVVALEEPVLFARVKLAWEPDPARPRPAQAEAGLDVDGDLIRASAASRSMEEAIDLLGQRLRDQLEHRARRREHLHRSEGLARPGEWQHGDLATVRPPYFDRPAEDRQLVRHKTFAVGELTCDEAIFDMDQLDYDFYLFRDLSSGSDSMVERLDDGSFRVTRVVPSAVDLGPVAEPVELSATPPPVLGLDEAMERLGASGERHLFFADGATGRGRVLYLRYDGHYGLIIPE